MLYLCSRKTRQTMEKTQDDILFKARSYRSIIRTALHLYIANLHSIFKASWLLTLIYALTAAVTGTLITCQVVPVGLQMMALPMFRGFIARDHWMLFAATALLLLLALIVGLLIMGKVGLLLCEHREEGHITKPIRWLAAPGKSLTVALRRIGRAAGRHWLLTLCLLVAGNLILVPFLLLAALPAMILLVVSVTAQSGTLMGDPLGLPAYLPWLSAGTWLIAAYIGSYLQLCLLFVGYYAYGALETRKKERKQQELNLQ